MACYFFKYTKKYLATIHFMTWRDLENPKLSPAFSILNDGIHLCCVLINITFSPCFW